ncbi:tho complex subunit 4c [Nicotiana attenuata]|uniref:Tho complex subunit 4c n=1 Tax=Nicotiana attenuata TaxID=49451 RepID=A0A314KLU4_NICAT|nr:tho complex subunit 4c [Nicotiana attenuata]
MEGVLIAVLHEMHIAVESNILAVPPSSTTCGSWLIVMEGILAFYVRAKHAKVPSQATGRDLRLKGAAEVVFARRSDAFQALKRYNNVKLDGEPMKIEIAGSNPEVPLSARVNIVGLLEERIRGLLS